MKKTSRSTTPRALGLMRPAGPVTYANVCQWENLRLAYHRAARGKRRKQSVAAFEYRLAEGI